MADNDREKGLLMREDDIELGQANTHSAFVVLGEVKLELNIFETPEKVEPSFAFHFRDALYGDDAIPDEDVSSLGSKVLVRRAFESLIGQVIRTRSGKRMKITDVFINYWQQIGARGDIIQE